MPKYLISGSYVGEGIKGLLKEGVQKGERQLSNSSEALEEQSNLCTLLSVMMIFSSSLMYLTM